MNHKPKVKDYIFLHVILLQISLCGLLSKFAASYDFLSFEFCLFYGLMIVNLGIYAILWQQVLKRISLTTAFCNKAVTIIWGMLWGFFIFHEQITVNMLIGAVIVLVGVCLVVTANE